MPNRRKTPSEAAAGLSLPPGISLSRERLPAGMVYVFRHVELGELGRMRVEGTPSGETCITCEVAGFEGDPMFARRREILEPLSAEITRAIESIGGPSRSAPLPPVTQRPVGRVPAEEVRCVQCGTLVAFLIFADDATGQGRFEDYARLMFPHYSAHPVPAYIIGPELGSGPANYRAEIMKVWPERAPIETLTPEQFKPRIDKLVFGHCR